jgi:hypothetical protein
MTDSDERLEQLARETGLPPEVRERLAALRRQAVQEADAATAGRRWPGWATVPVAGAAVALVLAVAVVVRQDAEVIELPLISEPDVAVIQEMDLLEELEFLAWLEAEAQGAG